MEPDKHVFIKINQDASDKSLKEDEARRILNLLPDNGGVSKDSRRVTVKGNTQVSYTWPSGVNTIFDKIEDRTSDNVLLFIHNDQNNHSIVRYDGSANTLTEVIQWSGLSLTISSPVEGGVVDGILIYSNGGEMKSININRLETNENGIKSALTANGDFTISYLKPPPNSAPVVTKEIDASVKTNRISDKNWQFAWRYIYLDDEKSVLSPYSAVVYANIIADHFDNNAIANRIKVEVDTGLTVLELEPIKSMEIFVREASTGDFRLFKTITTIPASAPFTEYFYNTEPGASLSEIEASVVQENIPTQSNSVAVTKGRVFGIKSKFGFDDDGDYTLSIDQKFVDIRSSPPAVVDSKRDFHFGFDINEDLKWFKGYGIYNVGVIFRGKRGRVSSVKSSQRVAISGSGAFIYRNLNGTGNKGSVIFLTRNRLGVTLSGTAPTDATHYQLAVSKELFYKSYSQVVVNLLYYVREFEEGNPIGANEFEDGGKIFLKSKPSDEKTFSRIYLQLPENTPIIPDSNSFVRFLNTGELLISDVAKVKPEPVLGTVGDFMVLDKSSFGIDPINLPDNLFIEIFKVADENDEIMYEVGPVYSISGGILNNSEHLLQGDTSIVGQYYGTIKSRYRKVRPFDPFSPFAYTRLREDRVMFESPTPHYSGTEALVLDSSDTSSTGETVDGGFEATDSNYSLDYDLAAIPGGRLNVVNKQEKERIEENVIFYSDLVSNSGILNGISNVGALNEYPLPKDSGRIVKLVPAGENLIVIHERFTTTLYLGDQFLKSGSADDILFKTDNVIGDDRKLKFTYGTVHPESAVENDGTVYFWDDNRGEPVRRDEAGLTPLARTADMQSWFKARAGLGDKVYGTFDDYLDLYIITFKSTGETICYSERHNAWVAEFSFAGDGYAKFRDGFVSFKNNEVWLHNSNSLHNNFYGVQYGWEIDFIANQMSNKDKLYRTISLDVSTPPSTATITNDKGQETDILDTEYELKDSIYYSGIKRDKNTPTDILKIGQVPIRHGKEIRSQTANVSLVKTSSPTEETVDSIIVGFIESPRANNLV